MTQAPNKPFVSHAIQSGKTLSKLTRPQNVLYPGLLAASIAILGGASLKKAILCYIVMLMLYALAAGFNNLNDVETDRINGRHDNPLMTGLIQVEQVKIFMGLCVLALAGAQWYMKQPTTSIVVAAYIVLALAYSHPRSNIMSRGIYGTVLLGVCYGSLALLLGIAQGQSLGILALAQLSLLQVVLLMPSLLAKDYKDLMGDIVTHKITPLIRLGYTKLYWLAMIISLLAAAWCILQAQNLTVLILAVAYCRLISRLHKKCGRLSQVLKLTLTVITLLMSISVYNTMV